MTSLTTSTAAVILVGGLARRMGGGDKCRQVVGGQTILARTISTISPQVNALALNANNDPARFADTALPIQADPVPGHPGPLAGILAGLDWVAATGHRWLLSIPGDCPFLPPDLASRLHQARGQATYAVAASGGWTHPVIALWPTSCREDLRQALRSGERKIDAFTAGHPTARAEWPTTPFDPFLNVNTPDDLAQANRIAQAEGGAAQTAPSATPRPG